MKKNLWHLFIGVMCLSFFAFGATSIAIAGDASRSGEKLMAKSETGKTKPAKTKSMKSEKVKAIQEALNKTGCQLKVDGIMGKKTREAIKKFQKDNALKVTGKADKVTLAKLGVK